MVLWVDVSAYSSFHKYKIKFLIIKIKHNKYQSCTINNPHTPKATVTKYYNNRLKSDYYSCYLLQAECTADSMGMCRNITKRCRIKHIAYRSTAIANVPASSAEQRPAGVQSSAEMKCESIHTIGILQPMPDCRAVCALQKKTSACHAAGGREPIGNPTQEILRVRLYYKCQSCDCCHMSRL